MKQGIKNLLAGVAIVALSGGVVIGGATMASAAAGDPYTTISNATHNATTPLQVTYSFDYAPTSISYGGENYRVITYQGGAQLGDSINEPASPAGHFERTLSLNPGDYSVTYEVQVQCEIVDQICWSVVYNQSFTVQDVPDETVTIAADSPTRKGLADGSTEADYNTVVIPTKDCVTYTSGGATVTGEVLIPNGGSSSGTAGTTCEKTVVTGGSWNLTYEAFSRSSTSTQRHDVKCEAGTIMEDTVLQLETRYVQNRQLTEWFAERPQITDTKEVKATADELKAAKCDTDPGTDPGPGPNPGNPGTGTNNPGTGTVNNPPASNSQVNTDTKVETQEFIDPLVSTDVQLRPSDWSNPNFVFGAILLAVSGVGTIVVTSWVIITLRKRHQLV